jgi:hypothetical protein
MRARALAYRQCFAAGKFVADDNGQPLQFCKENHSNGCIGTSDVFYPDGAAVSAVRSDAGQVVPGAVHELRRLGALEVPLRAARPGHSIRTPTARSTGAASGRKRTRCRSRRAATVAADGRRRPDGRQRRFRRPVLAATRSSGPSSSKPRASIRRTSSAPTTSPATWRTTST